MSSDNEGHDGPKGSDKALLDRLNALKPTNVTLQSPSATITPASTIERAKPPSREDALSDRLKNLRNQIGTHHDEPPATQAITSAAGKHPTRNTAVPSPSLKGKVISTPNVLSGARPADDGAVSAKKADTGETEEDEGDPLLEMTDDQTLEELLADLESDEQWVADVAAEEEEQHRKAMALLKELSPGGPGTKNTEDHEGKTRGSKDEDGDEDSDDDDSEGEEMACETDDILAKAMDEIELDKSNAPTNLEPPSPPQTTASTSQEGHGDETDFAASIASRMAALNVTKSSSSNTTQLPSVPTSEPDPFAALLPSAPTFSPTKSSLSGGLPGGIKRVGYTDEDQKSWCTVCLEDGAIRCIGCDGDIYCARCWKEMHVGPRAGFEERGHQWEKYDRRRD